MNRTLTHALRAALLVCLCLLLPAAPAADSTVRVRLIAINDLHGHLEPGDNQIEVPHPLDPTQRVTLRSGGAAYLATRVRQLRDEVRHSVLLSAGDLIGASPLVSAMFRDEPTIEVMNLIGLELNAVGNHEFDQGVTELRRMAQGGCAQTPRGDVATCARPEPYPGARFPFLAANVVDAAGVPLFAASWVKMVDGVSIGFIGAVTRSTPGIVMPTGIRGWSFLPEAAAINREAAALRARGVQALVAVIHEGGETDGGFDRCDNPRGEIFDIVRALDPAIDVVFSAHTHRGYTCRFDGRVVMQGASFGRLVSVVDVSIDRRTGDIRRDEVSAQNLPVPNGLDKGLDATLDAAVRRRYPALAPDPQVAALIAFYRDKVAPLAQRPVGRIAASFDRRATDGDSAAGRLIADAHLSATRINGAQLAFTNPGGIRSDLVARADGVVTYADAFTMQPFGNSLVTLTLTGAQLRTLLESQWSRGQPERVRFLQPSRGFEYRWSALRPHGQRIDPESLRLDGRRIGPDDRVRLTVNSFLAAGGDAFGVLRDAIDRVGGPLDLDALIDYLRRESAQAPLAPDPQPRIRRLD